MRITKKDVAIATLSDWLTYAGPKDPDRQWVEGRSAMEVARAWLDGAAHGPPKEVADLLRSNADFRNVVIDVVEPDARVVFDGRRGEPRNADLVFLGHDDLGPVVGSVEAKADEPFGPRLADVLNVALERAVANLRSDGIERVVELVRGLVPSRAPDTVPISELRYQLLTGIAGTLAVAAEHKAERAIFILHILETNRASVPLLAANALDASQFIRRLSSGSIENLEDGILYGPIQVRGEALSARPAKLYVGKATRRITDPTP